MILVYPNNFNGEYVLVNFSLFYVFYKITITPMRLVPTYEIQLFLLGFFIALIFDISELFIQIHTFEN